MDINFEKLISKYQQEFFEREGYVHLSNIPGLKESIIECIDDIDKIGKCFDPSFTIDSSHSIQSANKNGYYKAIRNSLPFYKIASLPQLFSISTKLGIIKPVYGGSNIRVDIFEEPNHKFNWHQDAPSLLGSKRMFTFWIPFTKVSEANGTVSIHPKSHKQGILTSNNCNFNGLKSALSSHTLLIDDFSSSDKEIVNVIASPGDIVVMHPLLVHASYYPLKAHKPRVTGLVRIDDYGDKEHLSMGFKTSQNGYNIHNSSEYLDYYSS